MVVFLYCCIEDPCKHCEVFLYCKVLVEREPAGHVSDYAPYILEFLYNIISFYSRIARVGEEKGGEDPEKGGFTGPVRANYPEYLSLIDFERDILQGFHPFCFVLL